MSFSSLLLNSMQECVLLKETVTDDGYGGTKTTYTADKTFRCAIVFDNSIQAKIAEKSGVTSLYTVTISRSEKLNYHDIFKRLSDNKIFRVTSDSDDKFTPATTALDMRQVSAEEWKI